VLEPKDFWVWFPLSLARQDDVVTDADVDNILWSYHKLGGSMHGQVIPGSIMVFRLPIKKDHLAVVPSSVAFLNVCQVERSHTKSFLVSRIHLGYPAVVGLAVNKGLRTMSRVVVVPNENWGVTPPLLPLNHIRDCLVIWEVCVAVEMDGLAKNGCYVLRVRIAVAPHD